MTAHWTTKPLGDICEILDSKRKPVTKSDRKPGPFPYYGATGILDYVADYIFDEKLILIGEDGAKWGAGENTAFTAEGQYWVNNHAHVIRPRRSIVLDEWIVYYINANDQAPFITGLTVPKLNQAKLCEIPVPLPPLAEQKRIVAILDEAFAGIAAATANAEKNLANARELFTSYVSLIFSSQEGDWTALPLGEICENLDSRRIPITKSDRAEGDIPYYGASGIVDYVAEHIFDEDILLISEDGANLLARTYPIAFSVSGKCWVNNHAHVVRFTSMATQRIVEFYLNSISLAPYVSGMAQPKLNQKAMNSIIVPLPPQEDHARIVGQIEMIQEESKRLEDNYSQKLAALNELKQAILQKAFSGDLTGIKTRHCEAA